MVLAEALFDARPVQKDSFWIMPLALSLCFSALDSHASGPAISTLSGCICRRAWSQNLSCRSCLRATAALSGLEPAEIIKEYFLNFYALNSEISIDLSGKTTIYNGNQPAF
jgi:hypothetical protein